jgi:DNA-binding transcriptional MerR regulator
VSGGGPGWLSGESNFLLSSSAPLRYSRRVASAQKAQQGAGGGLPALIKISDLARLSGVPTPTIKHYMREGLLPGPERRTSRNMAYYDARLADRVKVIKELQQERFLPLKIIGDLLEPAPSAAIRSDLDEVQRRQLGALEPAIRAGSTDARRRRLGRGGSPRRTRAEVLAGMRIGEGDLAILERFELVQPSSFHAGEAVYSGPDLELLEVIDETRQRGLGPLFPMEILEPYAAAIRSLVRLELELFRRQVLSGAALPPKPVDEIAREATQLAERMIVAMRAKLVIPELKAAAATPKPVAPDGEAPPRRRRGRA